MAAEDEEASLNRGHGVAAAGTGRDGDDEPAPDAGGGVEDVGVVEPSRAVETAEEEDAGGVGDARGGAEVAGRDRGARGKATRKVGPRPRLRVQRPSVAVLRAPGAPAEDVQLRVHRHGAVEGARTGAADGRRARAEPTLECHVEHHRVTAEMLAVKTAEHDDAVAAHERGGVAAPRRRRGLAPVRLGRRRTRTPAHVDLKGDGESHDRG